MKKCSSWEGLDLRKYMEDSVHESDPILEQIQSVRSLLPEEEGAVETMCDELTVPSIPCPAEWRGRGGREIESEVEPEKKGGVWGRGGWFYSSLF